ncbi:CPK1 [Symbiodinium natans]|uniref:CPK1 protein n=1 Tax=Symbiodinium natans TaxID=878477 RepID=A0A812N9G0_9DINO|nr:CPK1 [Symbiodinium natans]
MSASLHKHPEPGFRLDLIAANVANPKSTGPLPASLTTQLMDQAINASAGRHRGWVLCGCPSSMEETSALFLDLPVPPSEPAADPKKKAKPPEEPVIPDDAKVKEGFQVDMVIQVTSADEVCSARAQAAEGKPYVEKEFQAALDLWKKDTDAVSQFFVERLGAGQLALSADAAAEAEKEKHEAEVKAAEEEEREAPPAPDPADLVVLASGSWAWVDNAISTVVEALEVGSCKKGDHAEPKRANRNSLASGVFITRMGE